MEGSSEIRFSSGRVGAIAGGVVGALLAVVILLILVMVIVVIVLRYRHYNSLKSREANTQGMILLLLCHSETVLYLHVLVLHHPDLRIMGDIKRIILLSIRIIGKRFKN